MVGGGGSVGVEVGGKGVAVSDSVANVFRVGVTVGFKVKVGERVEGSVEVTTTVAAGERIFPSANDRDRPPKRRPTDTRAIKIPRTTCQTFFIYGSLPTFPPGQA